MQNIQWIFLLHLLHWVTVSCSTKINIFSTSSTKDDVSTNDNSTADLTSTERTGSFSTEAFKPLSMHGDSELYILRMNTFFIKTPSPMSTQEISNTDLIQMDSILTAKLPLASTQEESNTDLTQMNLFSTETPPPMSTITEFPQRRCEEAIPGCQCFDYDVVVGIHCPRIHFFNAHRLVEAFEPNTTFEVTLTGDGVLGRGILDGLIVYRLFLDGLEEVEEGAFEGVFRLRRFHVRLSALKEIPDFRPIRHSLRNVHMDNGQLTSVEGPWLTDLLLLDTLSMVNNSIRWVHPLAFQGTDNLVIFDLSRNLLSSLPPDLFSSWKKLKKVVLSRNRLLHVDRLFQITHPRFIYLDSNNLTDLDSILHPDMPEVETIQLSHNPLITVSNNSFNGRVNAMRFLYLDHCGIRRFDVRHYAGLSQLATLDLSYNVIEKIEHQTVDFGYNLELDLSANKITEFNAELTFNVRRVFLTANLLTSVGRTLQFSQMTEVALADNMIAALLESDLQGAHGVRALELQGNLIAGVDEAALAPVRRDLVHLDLSRNRLRRLGGCVRFLSALASLNLTDNLLEGFDEGEFTGLNELSELYLGKNHIVFLSVQLQLLPQLQYLVVSQNRIRTMYAHQIPKSLKYLYVEGNPFRCDCELLPFLLHLNSTSGPGTDVPLCLPPEIPQGIECPYPCSCACSEAGDHYIEIDCRRRNISETPALFSNVTHEFPRMSVSIQRGTSEAPFYLSDEVGALDISHNSISDLDRTHLPNTLRALQLDSNFLTSPFLPVSMPLLKMVSLGDNPWTCDCDALPLKKWILSKSDIVKDPNSTLCGPGSLEGRAIWMMMDMDLCPTDIGFYVSLAFAVLSACLLLAGFKIVWTRWSVDLRIWLYSKGVTWAKEKDMDREKRFDAFISFSHKDSNFVVEQIVNVVEKRSPNVRLCLHYKHFMPGEFIHENILNAVCNSKRTVLILSKNFLESEWCILEFRAAHVQALKDHVQRVIVIKVGDLPDDLIDPGLRHYLDTTTYLTWGEGNFWDNLLYVLPTSTPNVKPALTLDIVLKK